METIHEVVTEIFNSKDQYNEFTQEYYLEAVIEKLERVQLFLTEANYLDPNYNFTSLEEWDKYNEGRNKPNLVSLLTEDQLLNDAIEYNIEQAIQLLHHLKDINVSPEFSLWVAQKYEKARVLRNYIVHGDTLSDGYNDGFTLVQTSGHVSSELVDDRQRAIAGNVIELLFELSPLVKQLQVLLGATCNQTSIPMSVASSSNLCSPLLAQSMFSCSNSNGNTPVQNAVSLPSAPKPG